MDSSVRSDLYLIEVVDRQTSPVGPSAGLLAEIRAIGAEGVAALRKIQVYRLEGALSNDTLQRLAAQLFADPITQLWRILPPAEETIPATVAGAPPTAWVEAGWVGAGVNTDWDGNVASVEVAYNPGVMDPTEDSIRKGARDLGVELRAARTAVRYELKGAIAPEELRRLAERLLLNKTVQHAVIPGEPAHPPTSEYRFHLVSVSLREASDLELERLSREGQLWLTLDEMRAIQQYFREAGREPTDVELETLAQTWSEHCVHKTLRGDIRWRGQVIRNLLKSTIARATEELSPDWCLSVFKDNAGVITLDDEYAVCFKVETHNHPSALEPYGGASTGLGGVIRDILGTGLCARPILNTDVFCFGPPDLPYEKLPRGTLHPLRVLRGVRAGVADYGNRMGIPTSNGAILFDERYVGNPLVFCGTVGVMKREQAQPGVQRPGDLVLVVGGRTGRDGIHGATFSSGELTSESEMRSASSVQIGNPITEKRVQDALLKARDQRLFTRITDCGAGGLSSACGEMGAETGVEIDLEKAPLKYHGLSYTEIWISEAQERMVIAVPPDRLGEIMDLFAAEDVEAAVIGQFTDDHRLRLRYEGHQVADLPMDLLHEGLPRFERVAEWNPPVPDEPVFPEPTDLGKELKGILASLNVCSKEWVIRQYDHEVQGGSVLKPLVGVENDGPGDACVIRPLLDSLRAVAVSCGINPYYGDLDPYRMAASAIDEAIRQVVAIGAPPDRIALLDNFSWGNTSKPDRLGALVLACQACYDIARTYGTPFISGKDSLNNEYVVDGETICIPHTLLISSIAVLDDARRVVSMDAKAPGNLIYIVGATGRELGGSHYYLQQGVRGGMVPGVDSSSGLRIFRGVHRAIRGGWVRSCHDCSEGGIGVTAAEMAFAGGLGMDLNLDRVPRAGAPFARADELLFSESNSRFLVEVEPIHAAKFEAALAGAPHARIGTLTDSGRLVVRMAAGGESFRTVLDCSIEDLKKAWQSGLVV